ADEAQVQQVPPCATVIDGFAAQFHDGELHVLGCSLRRQGSSKRDGHRVRYALGPFPKEATTLETEDAAPESVQVNWNHRDVETVHDPFEPALEREQISCPADGTFTRPRADVSSHQCCRAASDVDRIRVI